MMVAQILNLMGSLSFGDQNVTETETSLFLQYLNLAHLELYGETATFNQDLYIQENLQKPENARLVDLSKTPCVMGVVYVPSLKIKLRKVSFQESIEHDPDGSHKGDLKRYCLQKNHLILLPYQSAPLSLVVWYIPDATLFMETTPEEEIPYPVSYHTLLADGALYYLFQDQSGFKNPQKMTEAKRRWVLGKQRLLSYLKGSNSIALSTFRNL